MKMKTFKQDISLHCNSEKKTQTIGRKNFEIQKYIYIFDII